MTEPTLHTPVPQATLDWLIDPVNPVVSVLTRRLLLRESDTPDTTALWTRRNEYPPVAAILDAMRDDGSWDTPARDYAKYRGSLWQIHLLGELHADGADERVAKAAAYAFSRQLPDGSWSATNMRPDGSIACLTANVGRALARMGFADDDRVVSALGYLAGLYAELGIVDCRQGRAYQLNGYCHMLTPKILLFLSEVPEASWPDGAMELRDECVRLLADKQIFRCLPAEAREFTDRIWSMPASERHGFRERFLDEHPQLHYKEKPGWLRFGFPLSYNSDILESLTALMSVRERMAPPYQDAVDVVAAAAGPEFQWSLRTTFNGKMYADIEEKGRASRWLTLRALRVLEWAAET